MKKVLNLSEKGGKMKNRRIKFAVTLYSLSMEYFTEKLDLEGCLKTVADMGYEGIEIVAAQMMPGYPEPSEEWMDSFEQLLKKYHLHPICYSAYIDMGTRSDRDLTENEIFQITLNDMMNASYMGFPIMRTQHAITPAIFEKMVPYAKKMNVKLTIELHRPHTMQVPVWQEYMNIIDRYGTEYLGIVPDFSIFQRTPHKLFLELEEKQGARKSVLDEACRQFENNRTLEKTLADLPSISEFERETVTDLYTNFYSGSAPVEEIKTLAKYAPYMHGKFYYLEEGQDDTCVPYTKLLPIIQACGYDGYIASEYEGHHFSTAHSSVEQLRRHITMEKRILHYDQ